MDRARVERRGPFFVRPHPQSGFGEPSSGQRAPCGNRVKERPRLACCNIDHLVQQLEKGLGCVGGRNLTTGKYESGDAGLQNRGPFHFPMPHALVPEQRDPSLVAGQRQPVFIRSTKRHIAARATNRYARRLQRLRKDTRVNRLIQVENGAATQLADRARNGWLLRSPSATSHNPSRAPSMSRRP